MHLFSLLHGNKIKGDNREKQSSRNIVSQPLPPPIKNTIVSFKKVDGNHEKQPSRELFLKNHRRQKTTYVSKN